MPQIKGKYSIENYTVTIDGIDEERQAVIYYDLSGNEITRGRYYGDPDEIPDGYVNVATESPIRVMRWQFRAQLDLEPPTDNNFATLKWQVEDIIRNMTGSQKLITDEAWHSAATVSRLSPTVSAIGSIVGLNTTQIDNIFISASTISI